MKSLLIAAVLAPLFALAAPPTAKVIVAGASLPTSPEVPNEVLQFSQKTGIQLTFLVEGQNLTEFKENSLVITRLEGPGIKPATAKRVTFEKFFSKVSAEGDYGSFTATIPTDDAIKALGGLKLRGSIKAYLAGETATGAATPLPAEGAPAVKVGEFMLSRTKATGGFFNSGNAEDSIAVTYTGPVAKLKELVVQSEGKTLTSNSSMHMGDTYTRIYKGDPKKPVTVRFTTWKTRPEVEIPLSHGE